MKLYYTVEEAWTVPGKQPRAAIRIDVPGQPGDLAAWLNARAVPPAPAAIAETDYGGIAHRQEPLCAIATPDAAPASPPTPPEQPPTSTRALQAVQANDHQAIVDWILETALPWQVEGVFKARGARFHEMRKAQA